MRIAYGDLIGGISGDMFVGALLDLGLELNKLKSELKKLSGLDYRIEVTKKTVYGIRATRFRVVCGKREPERPWKEIRDMIRQSALDPEVKEKGLKLFTRLAEAEGKIHGVAPDKAHFHEVGATDSIVDILSRSEEHTSELQSQSNLVC